MSALAVTLMEGAHDDPRLADLPVVFGLGSYIPHPIPAGFGYVYVVLRHVGAEPAALRDFWLETGEGRTARLTLPAGAVRGRILHPDQCLALGFLRHLFTREMRQARLSGVQDFTAHAALADGSVYRSVPLRLSLDYPTHPLEDVDLLPHAGVFLRRAERLRGQLRDIRRSWGSLSDYADLHHVWGLRMDVDEQGAPCWLLREYLPAAARLWLTTDKLHFQHWAHHAFQPEKEHPGWWSLRLPLDALEHGTYMELRMQGSAAARIERRVPALARWVEQDEENPGQWCARVWNPPRPYRWRHAPPRDIRRFPRIYEAHVGMAQDSRRRTAKSVGSYADFARQALPRIVAGGYTAVQLMGVVEHPLYKSFGYQVSSYFAPTSRCGAPDDFKALVDEAHGMGLAVILDIPHSHSCPNTEQGIGRYDGSRFFFAEKNNQWGTLSFDYGNEMARRFLLSNCRFWMEEYRVDGFRFDAVGNMIYKDHGFGDDFSHADRCFYAADGSPRADEDGILYLALANTLIHELAPEAVSIAEEFSGMPGLTADPAHGGMGFDFRFAMGVPDFWAKFIKEGRGIGEMWHELTNHRNYDATISYVECHDQSINGKDSMIWRLMGDAMYTHMGREQQLWTVSRGMALYKLMRLATLSTAHRGYLNFMGAEFGHPEWLDEAEHAHRQWHLADDSTLKYSWLAAFDAMCLRRLAGGRLTDFEHEPLPRLLCEDARTLAFERGRLLFVFNFHETSAAAPLSVMVTPGKYVEKYSTDAPEFGGHGNLTAQGLEHFSDPSSGREEQRVCLYLPPLTALVLERDGCD